MTKYSSAEAAKKLGLSPSGLSKHIRLGKIPAPEVVKTGDAVVHAWTDEDIERARAMLPKIANGRKTRHRKRKTIQARRKTKKKSKQ